MGVCDRRPNSPRVAADAPDVVAVAGGAAFGDSARVSEVSAADGRAPGLPKEPLVAPAVGVCDRPPNSPRVAADAPDVVAVAGGAAFGDSARVSEVSAADGRAPGLPKERDEPPGLPDLTAAPGGAPPAVTAADDLEFAAPERAGPAAAGCPGAGRSDRPDDEDDEDNEDEDEDEDELPTELPP